MGVPALLFLGQSGITEGAERVDGGEEAGGVGGERVAQRVVPVILKSRQELGGGDKVAGALEERRVGLAKLLEEVEGEFRLRLDASDGFLVAAIVLVAALFPVAKVLRVEARGGFAEFVDDDSIRQAVIKHAVDEVADRPGQAGDFAVASGVFGRRILGFDLVEKEGGSGVHKHSPGVVDKLEPGHSSRTNLTGRVGQKLSKAQKCFGSDV